MSADIVVNGGTGDYTVEAALVATFLIIGPIVFVWACEQLHRARDRRRDRLDALPPVVLLDAARQRRVGSNRW